MANHGFTSGKDIYSLEQLIKDVNDLKNRIKESYPVGSIYMSVRNVNPAQFFGGTWVAWGSGRVVVGMGGNYRVVEGTGGSESEQLKANQLPNHTHSDKIQVDGNPKWHLQSYTDALTLSGGPESPMVIDYSGNAGNSFQISGGGSSNPTPVSHMQPYITCYMWKRTA